jgi:hypothetical protein
MGRTVATYWTVLEVLINDWQNFRKGLRKEDQEAFDRLMHQCIRPRQPDALQLDPPFYAGHLPPPPAPAPAPAPLNLYITWL